MAIVEPIAVSEGDDMAFHRTVEAALDYYVTRPGDGERRAFDSEGRRLDLAAGLSAIEDEPTGAEELADLLRDWLGYVDAIRESTANWTLELLVKASIEHLGYTV